MFGQDIRFPGLSNLALDRIIKINESKATYIDTEIDFKEYFEDVVGVTVPDTLAEKVILKVGSKSIDYIATKALHGSQKIKEKEGDYTMVELDVIPNYELASRILSFGENVQVLQPAELRNQLKERVEMMKNIYQN